MYRTAKEMDAARADRANGTTDSDAALNGTVQAMLPAVTPRPTPWTWHAYMPVPDSLGWVAAADGSIVCRDVRAEEGRVICAGPGLLKVAKELLGWMRDIGGHNPERLLNPELDEMDLIGTAAEEAIAAASDFPMQLRMSVDALPKPRPITQKVARVNARRCPECGREACADLGDEPGPADFYCPMTGGCGWTGDIGELITDAEAVERELRNGPNRDEQRDNEEAAQVARTLEATIRQGMPGNGGR